MENIKWEFEDGRIFFEVDGELMAEATYIKKENGEIDIDHTFVNTKLRGQGIAGKMMKVVADYIREQELKTTASCSYAHGWLEKNKGEYEDIISADLDNDAMACKIGGNH